MKWCWNHCLSVQTKDGSRHLISRNSIKHIEMCRKQWGMQRTDGFIPKQARQNRADLAGRLFRRVAIRDMQHGWRGLVPVRSPDIKDETVSPSLCYSNSRGDISHDNVQEGETEKLPTLFWLACSCGPWPAVSTTLSMRVYQVDVRREWYTAIPNHYFCFLECSSVLANSIQLTDNLVISAILIQLGLFSCLLCSLCGSLDEYLQVIFHSM